MQEKPKGYGQILAAIILALILGGAFVLYDHFRVGNIKDQIETPDAGWKLYKSEDYKFSIHRLEFSSVNERDGQILFSVPTKFMLGTNLASDSRISVEISKECSPAKLIQNPNVKEFTQKVGRYTFIAATSSDAGAGNFYEEEVYVTPSPRGNGECYVVRMLLHSLNLGIVQETSPDTLLYDKKTLGAVFQHALGSLYLWD